MKKKQKNLIQFLMSVFISDKDTAKLYVLVFLQLIIHSCSFFKQYKICLM